MIKSWGKLKIEDVLPILSSTFYVRKKKKVKNKEGQVFDVNVTSLRLATFKTKGLNCCYCGRTATHFQLDEIYNNNKTPKGKPHLNLYSGDMLMTKEHIIPKSSGGKDHLDNMETCCEECNQLRSDLILPSIN